MSKRKPSKIIDPAKPWFEPAGERRGALGVQMTKTVVKAKSRKLKGTWRIEFADFNDTSNDDAVVDGLISELTEEKEETKPVDYESDWS